jgi:choline monooxygenase
VPASLAKILSAFDPELPLDRARTIPSNWYFAPAIAAAEARAVFGNSWQLVGRVEQVQSPGQFLTYDHLGPLLVVRDSDSILRAFYNVCRHRAAHVATEAAGTTTRFRCRYHGWTYDLAGRLRGTPEFDGVADFCREDNGLAPVAVDICGPFVFIHMGPKPPPLAEFLAPFPERSRGLGIDRLRFLERRDYVLACNWKVFVDNYLDGGYHVNTVHPGLAGVIDYTHYRTEIAGNTSVQISPLRPPDPEAGSTGKVRTGNAAYYWWIFPNLMINLYDGVMDTNLVVPMSGDRCRVIFDFYFADTDGPEAKRFISESIAVAEQIQQEDIGICEEVQRGLASPSFATGRFSVRREAAGYYFHQLLARCLQNEVTRSDAC